MSVPATNRSLPPIPRVAFYSLVTGFWLYASFTRIGQWTLMRQALPKWGVPPLDVQIVECVLLFPLLLVLCTLGRRVGYDFRDWRRAVTAFQKLGDLAKTVRRLEERLAHLEGQEATPGSGS